MGLGSWLHHGKPGSRPKPAFSTDVATRYVKGPTQLAVYFYNYRIDDLIERYQTQTDFFFFRNRGRARIRGFRGPRSGTALPRRLRALKSARTSGAARRSMTTSTSTTSPPIRSRCWLEKTSTARAFAQMRTAFLADDGRPGPSEVMAPGGDADRSRRRIQVREIPRAPRQRPQPARRRLLRQPGSALGLRAGPIGERCAPRLSVLNQGIADPSSLILDPLSLSLIAHPHR